MQKLTHLSLFSGIGGLDLAAEWAGFETIGQCEWAEYPTKVLEKHWPDVERWKDIRTLTGESFYERTGRGTVDIISGGFPCQPFSVAGKQRGEEDDRYLWPEMVRVIKELRPTWIVGENVAGIVRMALPDILSELETCGYRTRTFLIPACAVGARHRRYRVAIVAHAERVGERGLSIGTGEILSRFGGGCEDVQYADCTGRKEQHIAAISDSERFACGGCDEGNVPNSNGTGLQTERAREQTAGTARKDSIISDANNGSGALRRNREFSTAEETRRERSNIRGRAEEYEPRQRRPAEPRLGRMADGIPDWVDGYWDAEPAGVPRVANGVPDRVGRLKALGNAVVPQQFYPIFKAIAEIERSEM